MKVGLFHTVQWPEGSGQADRYRQSLEQATLSEELGYDSVWFTEHHFFRHGIVSDSISVLAYLAARTSTLRLGTAVSVLPLHNPVRLAEATATLDVLSGGRLELGIGKGYQTGEFKGMGVDIEHREERFAEALEIILKGWTTDEPFTHVGRTWSFEDANPQPKPLQRPHPPIWMATDSDSGFHKVAQNGWGLLLPQGRSPHAVADQITRFKSALADEGREYDPQKVILARAFYCAPTDEQAWGEAEKPYGEFVTLASSLAAPGRAPTKASTSTDSDSPFSRSPFALDEDIRASALFGSPETCIEMLEQLREIGIERVIGFAHIGGLEHRKIVESLKLFATEVLPAVSGRTVAAS
jgi:probable F420-dependent oxidoreductase